MKDFYDKLNDPKIKKNLLTIFLDAIHNALKETLK